MIIGYTLSTGHGKIRRVIYYTATLVWIILAVAYVPKAGLVRQGMQPSMWSQHPGMYGTIVTTSEMRIEGVLLTIRENRYYFMSVEDNEDREMLPPISDLYIINGDQVFAFVEH